MPNTVSIHDAKTNLSKYIAAAKKGKKIFIGSFGKPEVMLVKLKPADLSDSKYRNFQVSTNKVKEQPDSFSDQTDQQVSELLLG